MAGMFKGGMSQMKAGKKTLPKGAKQEGPTTQMGADFLIDANDVIEKAHYNSHVASYLTVDQILKG